MRMKIPRPAPDCSLQSSPAIGAYDNISRDLTSDLMRSVVAENFETCVQWRPRFEERPPDDLVSTKWGIQVRAIAGRPNAWRWPVRPNFVRPPRAWPIFPRSAP